MNPPKLVARPQIDRKRLTLPWPVINHPTIVGRAVVDDRLNRAGVSILVQLTTVPIIRVHEFVNSSGYNCGDDQLYSCGGDNDDALYRRRSSGAVNAAYDNMARVMSQDPHEPQQEQQQLQRRNSSYRQQEPQSDDYVNLNHLNHLNSNDDDSFSNSSHVVIASDNCDAEEPCSDDVPSRR